MKLLLILALFSCHDRHDSGGCSADDDGGPKVYMQMNMTDGTMSLTPLPFQPGSVPVTSF